MSLKHQLFTICILALVFACKPNQPVEEIGEFAPQDAYLQGSKHPYYGSENKWDRRFFYQHIKDFYKRRGQRQMLDLVEGRPDETMRYCKELLAADPKDLESLFNLAVAQARLHDLSGAMQTVKQAVDFGLPLERFLAGPRDVLRPLTESDAFKKYAAQFDIQLLHGPMVDCVTDRSARFWLRTVNEVDVQVIASPDKQMSNPVKSGLYKTQSQNDYTAIVNLEELEPATTYYYDLLIENKAQFKPNFPVFNTYPPKGSKSIFSIGFGGGAGYVPANERMWDVIHSRDLLAFLFMGDNVYINMPQLPNGVHYYTYYRRQSRPEFRRLVSSRSIYAIWDDHDCATDDVWMGPFKDKPSWKLPLFNVFKENWNNPGYGDPEWPGCWFDFSIADVDFFMLECRFYRTNPYEPNPTMLGPVQKKWLLDKLLKSNAAFKVIASSVPWALATKGEARDTWNGFKEERQEIFDFLADYKIDGVILLSADRHRSDAWRIERTNGYPLYEFESSRLTNQHVHELMPQALFGYNEKQSFGMLTFDTTAPDPSVTFQIISIDNEKIHTLTIKKSEISHVD